MATLAELEVRLEALQAQHDSPVAGMSYGGRVDQASRHGRDRRDTVFAFDETRITPKRRRSSRGDGESLPIVRHGDSELRLWTFAGGRANAALAAGLAGVGLVIEAADNFCVRVAGDDPAALARALDDLDVANLPAPVPARALAKLKFSACLPEALARSVLTARLTDNASVQDTLARPRRLVAARA